MTDLTGQKFNHWTVLELDKERSLNSGRKKYWICECDCEEHTIRSVRSDGLTSGGSKSCGCYNRKLASERMSKIAQDYNVLKQDLTDQTFGYWHVDSRAKNQNNHVAWNCTCKCGVKRIVLGQSLKNGTSQSCGCLNMSHGEKKIQDLLDKANIPYIREYSTQLFFKNKNSRARFDFFVNNQYAIEFDGIQHYVDQSEKGYFQHGIETIQEYDKLKNQYCKENNIPIIRIPYTHLKDLCLEDLLLETSQFIIKEGE